MKLIFAFFLLLSTQIEAKIIDKILAVVNDKVITLSDIQRTQATLPARRNISPQIYRKSPLSEKEAVEIAVRRNIIRDKLTEIGYIVSDDQVESQVKGTEQKLGLNRKALIQFLTNNGVTFDEYFEIIRETIEHNIFGSRIIAPLISVTDQQIKNVYQTKGNKKGKSKTVTYRYDLVDYSIDRRKLSKKQLSQMQSALTKYQKTKILPSYLRDISSDTLGEISEDGLTKELSNILKKTREGRLTKPILLGSEYHVFLVKKKELAESEVYSEAKEYIKMELLQESADSVADSWFEAEKPRYYIRYFF
jgi:peptidyl-prolyl cis-trans isomerase SurA